jgi:hypothetical protein
LQDFKKHFFKLQYAGYLSGEKLFRCLFLLVLLFLLLILSSLSCMLRDYCGLVDPR